MWNGRIFWVFALTVVISSCGSADRFGKLFSERDEVEPTEEEYQEFLSEIDQILLTHHQYKIKILRLPILGLDDIEGDVEGFQNEIKRIFDLPYFTNHRKFRMLWPRMWKEKGNDYRAKYVREVFSMYGNRVGDVKSPMSFMMSPMQDVLAFYTEDEIITAAEQIPLYAKKVEWDGVRERFRYMDMDLKQKVIIISSALNDSSYRQKFKSKLLDVPAIHKKLRTNTKTSDLKTQFEPMDLTHSLIANFFQNMMYFGNDGQTTSPIIFQKLTHRSLYAFYGSHKEDDEPGAELDSLYVLRKFNSGDEFDVFCADGGHEGGFFEDGETFIEGYTNFAVSLIKQAHLKIFTLIEKDKLKFAFSCEGIKYNVELKSQAGDAIPMPGPFNLDKFREHDPIRVVIPFALTQEIDKKARFMFHRYLNYRGFRHRGERKDIPTRPLFEQRALQADIIIPVAHSLDVNDFQLGTKKSVLSRYTRKFRRKDGSRVPVVLDVFFPSKKKNEDLYRENLNVEDLAKIFHKRRHTKDTSLFIFNNSCFAQNALWTWMKAYRKSADMSVASGLKNSFEELQDMPHIIASKGGFPTTTIADTLSNVMYPFAVIKELAMGSSPEQLYQKLKKANGVRKDPVIAAIQRFQAWRRGREVEKIDFQPVYNVKFRKLFEMNGYRILLQPEGSDEVIEY